MLSEAEAAAPSAAESDGDHADANARRGLFGR